MEGKDFFGLPTEIQLHIMNCLSLRDLGVVACVCSHLKTLAYDKSLWFPLDFSEDRWRTRKDLDPAFSGLLRIFQDEVVNLNVAFCADNLSTIALMSIGICHNLRSLSLAWCRQVNDAVLWEVATYCRALRHLDLRGCAHISVETLTVCLSHCLTSLESLVIDYCVMDHPRELVALCEKCPSLQRLSCFFLRFQQHEEFSVWTDYASYFRRAKKEHLLDRVTLETDIWKKAYFQSLDVRIEPKLQITAAAERAGKEGKLLLLCVSLGRGYKMKKDWSMRMEYFITLNPLIWKRLNETFVWLLIDESEEDESLSDVVAMNEDTLGEIEDWKSVIKSLSEWPYLFVIDANAHLLARQTTGPLERYERYDHETILTFISNWSEYLKSGVMPPQIEGQFEDTEPAYSGLLDLEQGEYIDDTDAEDLGDELSEDDYDEEGDEDEDHAEDEED